MGNWILQFPWEEEIGGILMAPISFFIAIILGWGIICFLMRLFYARERAINRSTIDNQRDQIASLESRLRIVAEEEAGQLRRGELDLKGQRFGNRFVLGSPRLEISDSALTNLVPEIGTVVCPPNSLVRIKYRLRDNVGGLARLAIRRVGSLEEPTLKNSGEVEVLVNEESQFEYVVDKVISAHNLLELNVTLWLLGWTEP